MYPARLTTSVAVGKPIGGRPNWASPVMLEASSAALNPTAAAILADKQSYTAGTTKTPGPFREFRSSVVFFISLPSVYFLIGFATGS
jgi:hypothetical protein